MGRVDGERVEADVFDVVEMDGGGIAEETRVGLVGDRVVDEVTSRAERMLMPAPGGLRMTLPETVTLDAQRAMPG